MTKRVSVVFRWLVYLPRDVDSHWMDYKVEIVVNRGVEVTLSKELKRYFRVVREDGLC